ncbi:MAG: hypothetical protein O2944_01805 [Proteobacteria bacterium]|nr:hypothetical protein [Pseudomonadota bacterium]
MQAVSSSGKIFFAAAFAAALGGCAISKENTGTFAALTDEQGRVVIGAPDFTGPALRRVGFADILEREEYSLFRGSGGQAEALFAEARTDMHAQTVLDFSYLVEAAIKMFRFNQGQAIEFSDAKFVKTSFGGAWTRSYLLTGSGHACIGFYAEWDHRPDDPKRQPSKGLFGYACRPAGKAMPDADALAIVQSIDLQGITVPLRIKSAYNLKKGDPPELPKGHQIELMVAAQDGTPGAKSGLPAFPLLAARGFTMQDSSDFNR